MMMPGRSYSAGRSYRYGFNGKENDKDAGEGIQDYGMRIFSERLGRFLSVDPMTKSFPWYTPYQFAGNKPISSIDLDGNEPNPSAMTAAMNKQKADLVIKAQSGDVSSQESLNYILSVETKLGTVQFGLASAGIISGGILSAVSSASVRVVLSNLTYQSAIAYTTYSTMAANTGAFIIELLNPDPNGTPGLEFTQGDEVARGLKLLFSKLVVPYAKPIERFIINTQKFDYLFGKLEYQNLSGVELGSYAKKVGRTVENLIKNQDRASSIAKVFEDWGIHDTKAGFDQLSHLFEAGLKGDIVRTKTDEYGTSIFKEITLIFTSGDKKGQPAGKLMIGYFYKNGNMSATPEITSVIPIPPKSD